MCLCDCQSSCLSLMMGVVDSELAQQVEAFAMYPRDLGLICGTRNLCVLLSLFFFFSFLSTCHSWGHLGRKNLQTGL